MRVMALLVAAKKQAPLIPARLLKFTSWDSISSIIPPAAGKDLQHVNKQVDEVQVED